MKEIIRNTKPKVQVEIRPENEEKIISLFEELGYSAYKVQNKKLAAYNDGKAKIDGDFIFICQEKTLNL
jgi:adenylate cyclase class IV